MKGLRAADCVLLYNHKSCAHAFEQARGGSGAWYAMELTELLPHVARGLNINWDEATRYAGLTSEF
jgi:hypothetical protein